MSEEFKRIRPNCEQRGLEGFTLIEVLIVIVVLGILAAIVVFALGGFSSSSAAAACATDAKSVSYAIAAEQVQTPNVPPVYATGSDSGDLAPAYLATLPANSDLYTIGLSPDNSAVEVTLNSNDPGEASTLSDAPGGLKLYDPDGGTAAFTFGPSDGSLAGQGICAGA
jgi:prepilin-type N-terminal cleavage/methylation domain-containing protein